jgi:hypothetical protein
MSITIEEAIETIGIQHEQLESLRAQLYRYTRRSESGESLGDLYDMADQLAEKDAMLGKCVEAAADLLRNDERPPSHEQALDAIFSMERLRDVLASLPTTTQDVIAKVRNETEEKRMRHELKRESAGKAEMGSITPTCSCGWRGHTEYAYNDYQHTNVKEQENDHIRNAQRALKTEVK